MSCPCTTFMLTLQQLKNVTRKRCKYASTKILYRIIKSTVVKSTVPALQICFSWLNGRAFTFTYGHTTVINFLSHFQVREF